MGAMATTADRVTFVTFPARFVEAVDRRPSGKTDSSSTNFSVVSGHDDLPVRIGLRHVQAQLACLPEPDPGVAGITNLSSILGDATQSLVLEATFDLAFLCTVLGEITDRAAALTQCYRALKLAGRRSITEIVLDPHYQSGATVRRFAEEAGFRLLSIEGGWWFYTANFVKA